jgi:hypothetical protein
MPHKKPTTPTPLDLLFMLIDTCMHRLTPNAWKVVCYVAAQHLRVHSELLERISNPAIFALNQDLEKAGRPVPSGESGERHYRPVANGPTVPAWGDQSRFAVISLDELCHGIRTKRRWRDHERG